MADFVFVDALTGDGIVLTYEGSQAAVVKGQQALPACESIFFPGCSLLNYAMPLVSAVYNTLLDAEAVDGLSALCCGKILSYEPDGDALRQSFEEELREHIARSDIKRIICACPNCVKALHEALAEDNRTAEVSIEALPEVLAKLGYRLDASTCAQLVKGDADADVMFCPHDSCPDRHEGAFARGLREIVGEDLYRDPEHCFSKSVCCGSLPRAAGKFKQADKCADINGREALEVGADALITACMSCDFQLNMAQPHIQCVHYLEMLYSWRINWAVEAGMMKLRFLFNDTLGAIEQADGDRLFAGLGKPLRGEASEKTVADIGADAEEERGEAPETADSGVAISNRDTELIGQ